MMSVFVADAVFNKTFVKTFLGFLMIAQQRKEQSIILKTSVKLQTTA